MDASGDRAMEPPRQHGAPAPDLYGSTATPQQRQQQQRLGTAAAGEQQQPRDAAVLPDDYGGDGVLERWDAALGNVEDARVAVDTLSQAIEDAVYLDEDAYNQVLPATQYTRVIQAQHRRIAELEAEVEGVRGRLAASDAARRQAELSAAELQHELENNAVVFKMHYGELLLKEEEILRLKSVIEGLATGR